MCNLCALWRAQRKSRIIMNAFRGFSMNPGLRCAQFESLLTGSGPDQACGVSVVNGKDSSQSTVPFTYTLSLTPLVTEISPRRGSTVGGTRLTVTGSGFRYRLHTGTHQQTCSWTQAVGYPCCVLSLRVTKYTLVVWTLLFASPAPGTK